MGKFGAMGWIGSYAAVAILVCVAAWFWFRPEPRTTVILAFSCALSIGVAGLIMYNASQRTESWERIRREGQQATARVLQVESTNVIINSRPQVRMRLAIRAPGTPPYEVERVDTVALGQSVMPGRELTVYVDRKDRQNLVIDWDAPLSSITVAPSPTASPDTSKRLDNLKRLRDQGQITEDEYQAQRQRILSEL